MTTDQLIDTTAWLFGIERTALMSTSRVARIVKARQALAWALRQNSWSLEEIGDFLHRDHTTVIYSIKVVERRARHDQHFRERLSVLTVPASPPIDWKAKVQELEARVAELEALLLRKAT